MAELSPLFARSPHTIFDPVLRSSTTWHRITHPEANTFPFSFLPPPSLLRSFFSSSLPEVLEMIDAIHTHLSVFVKNKFPSSLTR